MKIDRIPEIDFTPAEQEIDHLCENWADCAAGFRLGDRRIRRADGTHFRCFGLLTVHELFEVHRQNFENGDRAALFNALRLTLEENLPAPLWLADALTSVMDKFDKQPGLSLHTAMGLDSRYPLTAKKANTNRRNWNVSVELWGLVRVHQKEHGSSVSGAIADVLASNPRIKATFSQRKAYDAFMQVDRVQSPALTAVRRSR